MSTETETIPTIAQTIRRIQAQQRRRKRLQRRKPRCEVCHKKPAVSFSRFYNGQWLFTCYCTSDYESHYVMVDQYRRSHAARENWDDHLAGKVKEYNTNGFYLAVDRWREAGGTFKRESLVESDD
jgi:hypothetical protein